MSNFQVANLCAQPGQKVQGFLEVPGTEVKMPTTLINGAKEGKTVVITGGTHGSEYPGVETAIRLAQDLDPANLSGRVAIIHPVNVPAFYAKLQYIGPYDGKNLNREYPGLATGTVTQRIAYLISQNLFTQADAYFDLHGGDIHEALTPFVIYSKLGDPERVKLSVGLSKATGIKYLIGSVSDNGTFGCAATMGVPGFLGEIGNLGLWSEGEVKDYYNGIINCLKLMKVLPGEVEALRDDFVLFDHMNGMNAGKTGCWYPCVELEQDVKVGDKLGVIKDFFGNVLEEYTAPEAGTIVYVIASLAIREGDPIVAIGVK